MPVRIGHVRHDPMLEPGLVQRDGLGRLLEQVDHRRAAELERVRADVLLQLLRAPVHEQDHLQLLLEAGLAGRSQAHEVDEQELAGEREELAEQAIARERRGRVGEQAVLELEADLAQAVLGRQEDRARLGRLPPCRTGSARPGSHG